MNNLNIKLYHQDLKNDWDFVVSKSNNGTFFHCRKYIDYNSFLFNESSLIIYQEFTPVAIFPSNSVDNKVVSYSGLTYAGLIYTSCLKIADLLEIYNLIIITYRKLGFSKIQIKQIPSIFQKEKSDADLYALHRTGARIYRRDLSSVIKITEDITLNKSRLNSIRNYLNKNNFTILNSNNFSQFHDLLSKSLSRHNTKPVHSVSDLIYLAKSFPENIFLWSCHSDAQCSMDAAALIFNFGKTVHTQYLTNSDIGRKKGALDVLLFELITNIYSKKSYFSFGTSTEQDGEFVNEGLYNYKRSFGSSALCHDFYLYDL